MIKKNDRISIFFNILKFLQNITLYKIDGSKIKYPKVIQLPITKKCNSRCVMCNIWKMGSEGESTVAEFSIFLSDPLFKEVTSVGINGGEPTLVGNLPDYAKEVLKLPSLKSLNIISNGFNKNILLQFAKSIYSECQKRDIAFHISISLDGYKEIHDKVRGIKGAFDKTVSTIDELKNNPLKYCDSFDLGCTVVNQNIHNLIELDAYSRMKGYNIKYRLGIENKRIGSDKILSNFSVIDNENSQAAIEFFHYKMSTAKNIQEKFKYYSIFKWLSSTKKKRSMGCIWKDEGVTMNGCGELFYCAVSSDSIGNLRSSKGEDLFFDPKNIEHRKEIIQKKCDHCIHDYAGKPELRDMLSFISFLLVNRLSMIRYRFNSWMIK